MQSVAETQHLYTFDDMLRVVVATKQATTPEKAGAIGRGHAAIQDGHVLDLGEGNGKVLSKDGHTWYTVNSSCDCEAAGYGKACHHLSTWNLYKEVKAEYETQPPFDPDADAQDDEGWPPGQPLAESPAVPGPALPEAPASVNVRLTVAGRDVQLTLRGVEEAEVLTRLEAVLARYPQPELKPPPTPPLSTGGHGKGWCAIHNEDMRWNEGKDGRKGWYSHKVDGEWCKGRVRRA